MRARWTDKVYEYEPVIVGIDGVFEWTELRAGQQNSGLVVFQAPTSAIGKGSKIEVNSFWGEDPSAYSAIA